jgi:2',3'-cyclic-nucleotide 2'-phosphodiesterase (5'-nucleotidase family)
MRHSIRALHSGMRRMITAPLPSSQRLALRTITSLSTATSPSSSSSSTSSTSSIAEVVPSRSRPKPAGSTRVIHFTDIHFQLAPTWRDMFGKRAWGTTHLYALGRATDFSIDVQRKVVQQIIAEQPDLVLFSGDVTAQALQTEYDLSRRELAPILRRFPTMMIQGIDDRRGPL